MPDIPCLSLAISRLESAQPGHYALWVLNAPYPGGYVHRDCSWPQPLTQSWHDWQLMFSQSSPSLPKFASEPLANGELPPLSITSDECATIETDSEQSISYSSRLMQHLGVGLWQWLFDGSVRSSLDQSQGIAIGQGKPIRLRLDIRDPDLTNIPWEIMQPEAGMQAISLGQQMLFSRTTSAVDPLLDLRAEHTLKILLVLGQASNPEPTGEPTTTQSYGTQLELEREAQALAQVLKYRGTSQYQGFGSSVDSMVDILVQPTAAKLVDTLDNGKYNVLFYSGHGMPAPDGGLLFLRPDATLNGTELAQVLTRCQIKLAVFNACWGAQPDRNQTQELIPRSSLAEVLIHHGVPAVLAMRDTIADAEALSFIEAFTQALVDRASIDQAVAIARQQLLTLYRFNQPAWTLPVLYMHPEYDGELIRPAGEGVTEMPDQSPTWIGRRAPLAFLRAIGSSTEVWPIQGGLMRVGKMEGNDLIINEPGVSRQHAEIFYRDPEEAEGIEPSFYLRDYSRYGTLLLSNDGWRRVHQQEIPLQSRTQLKFGSHRSQALEFVIDLSKSK
ncbi:MAG: CHAT domain-containing protein [Cyanobacteria bacterium P01_E01_bin.6]